MKAAVCYEFARPLVVEEVVIDPPKKGEVKVRIAATAICHSDIHVIKGELGDRKLPIVPGHESAGYVEEVGENVSSVRRGDAVVVSLLKSCRRCHFCVTNRPHLCEAKWPLTCDMKQPNPLESRLHNKQGENLSHMMGVAGFAEFVIVDESQVVPISKEIPMECAALLACGVITGFGAVVYRARVEVSSSVVVIGIGGVGLNSLQGAAISGAYPIIAVDISDRKLEAARAFGATHTINANDKDALKKIQDLTSGRGADYVFVTVGNTAAVQQGFLMSGPRGMTVVVGIPPKGETVSLPPFLAGERMFSSCFMGSTRLSIDIPKLVALYRAGRLKLDELVTNRYPLEQINEAIESTEKGEALRNVIMF